MSLKMDIKSLYQQADVGASLQDMMKGICAALKNNQAELSGITWSYRLCASDTGYVCAFSLADGHYADKSEMDEADVIVTGKERDLLNVFQRKVAPMSAVLRGKIRVKGSTAALVRLAEFL